MTGVIKDGQCCAKCESYSIDDDEILGECHHVIEWPPIPVALHIQRVYVPMRKNAGQNCYCFEERDLTSS